VSAPVVVAYDEQEDHPLDLERWRQLAEDVLAAEGIAIGELTVLFVDEQTIADLHELHMGDATPTDVLSFPLDAESALESSIDDVPLLLGDVVVCPAVAMRNAAGHAGSIVDELALLVVHGTLHILGHDHADPEQEQSMQSRERALLERHHWRGEAPATFRAHGPSRW
jgi:probable rRNA maturation factor